MFTQEQQAIENNIRTYCEQYDLPDPGEINWTHIPFEGEWGISTSFFQLAALESRTVKERTGKGLNVPQHAQEIAEAVAGYLGSPPGFSRVEAVKGYLNLYFSQAAFARRVVDTVLEEGSTYGGGAPKGKLVMVEFSQPNTHKSFHVGHLRSAILGDALCRILEFAGYDVVRANYLGDIGLHVIRWLWNYMKFHAGEKPAQDTTRWMGDIYAEAIRRLDENPEYETEVRELYARWDQQDPEVVALWEETRQWSVDGFNQLYEILDIRFDRDYANSQAEQPGKVFVEELIERGIAEDERPGGPVIVRIDEKLGLDKEKYRVLVILRSDGTALYATEDLALAQIKFSDYDLERSLYVVDVRQSLHFQQVFKTLEIAGFEWADRCLHLGYELVNLPGNVVMASREGNFVLLEDLIREATQRAYDVVVEKNPALSEDLKQAVSQAVGLGSLKYPMLARDNAKLVTFDWESALDFNGHAAPYIQYAHVRATSIMRKAAGDVLSPQNDIEMEIPQPLTPAHELDSTEIQLIDLISRLPNDIQRSAEEYKTLHITNLAYNLARAFTDFYNQCPVIKAEPPVRDTRLRLVAASRVAIANLLGLLGIHAPDVM
jgi:arginyl-tRNA synthetase